MTRIRKKEMNYREFRGGYTKVPKAEVEAIIEGYRAGRLKRAELRVWAGTIEYRALCKDSRVTLYRVVNSDTADRGKRRLSEREINDALAIIESLQNSPQGESSLDSDGIARGEGAHFVRFPRVFARHMAKGGCTCNEAIVLAYYSLRRMRQGDKPHQKLCDDERYARFTYGELEVLSGIPRANLSRAVTRLRHRGYLQTISVHKQNENAYGQLFVDGRAISMTNERRHETTTPARRIDNAPRHKSTTLRKNDPKTQIQKEETQYLSREELEDRARHERKPFLADMWMRAALHSERFQRQVA